MENLKKLTTEQLDDAKRLKALYESKKRSLKITQQTIADALDVSQGAVGHYLNGRNALNIPAASAFARLLGVSIADFSPSLARKAESISLVAKTSYERKSDTLPPPDEWMPISPWDSKTPVLDDEVEVPFLKDIEFACGNGRISNEDRNGYKIRFSKATLRRVGANSDGSGVLCFPAAGDSMEPIIPDGTTVAIDTNNKRIVDGKLYAIGQDDGYGSQLKRIKQLYRKPGGKLVIRSYNSDEYPDEEAGTDSVDIIGRVFWYSVLL